MKRMIRIQEIKTWLRPVAMRLGRLLCSPLGWFSVALLIGAAEAAGRPGGGHTYSGGGGSLGGGGGYSGGGGGSGGGGQIVMLLLYLMWDIPYIGVPLVLAIVGGAIYWYAAKRPFPGDSWDSGQAGSHPGQVSPAAGARRSADLEVLRQQDPNFSQVVFEDFLYGLYSRAQESRVSGGSDLALLSPYLSKSARAELARRGGRAPDDVTGVVVGAMRVVSLSGLQSEYVRIAVDFEANYTEIGGGPNQQAQAESRAQDFYAWERWHISRKRSARSRSPDKVHSFNCPSCGAPVESTQDERCSYCGSVFGSGEFDWFVDRTQVMKEELRPPRLTGHVEERGTDLPTIKQPDLAERLAELQEKDEELDFEALKQRIGMIFTETQAAWSSLEWTKARPFVTDRFYLSQLYWIKAYRNQGLRNVLDGSRITNLEMVKVARDPFFDAVTFRVYATGCDYTIEDSTGKVVSGKKTVPRPYSEYWTLIRSAEASGKAKTEKTCPNCGGPLNVNQSGFCEYCGSKITGGEFDWVLSRIEQDDSYSG